MKNLPDQIRQKILTDSEKAIDIIQNARPGRKLVFTNGCFDILHKGHLHLLIEAKKLGDLLIIGLNTDESVSRLKGPERPVNDLETRSIILAALELVDYIIPFGEDTPEQLITRIVPDVLVKGNDYKIDEIAGASFVLSNGGEVKTVSLLQGFSTTAILDKSKKP